MPFLSEPKRIRLHPLARVILSGAKDLNGSAIQIENRAAYARRLSLSFSSPFTLSPAGQELGRDLKATVK